MNDALTIIATEGSKLEYAIDGITFFELPFEGDITSSGGEAPEADVVTFKEAGKVVGHPRVPNIAVAIASLVPSHASYDDIYDGVENKLWYTWRITTREEEFFSVTGAGMTVAIATTGICTFVGAVRPNFAGKLFGLGMVISAGGQSIASSQSAMQTSQL